MLGELLSPRTEGTSSVFAISTHCLADVISTHSSETGLSAGVYVGLIGEQMESFRP